VHFDRRHAADFEIYPHYWRCFLNFFQHFAPQKQHNECRQRAKNQKTNNCAHFGFSSFSALQISGVTLRPTPQERKKNRLHAYKIISF
jgi:hypothetical protein